MEKVFNFSKMLLAFMLIILTTAMFTSCGKDGTMGPAGPMGPSGPAGNDGTNATAVSGSDQAAYDAADGVTGARLYDHVVNQIDTNDLNLVNNTDFFRCKSCHGWDLHGQNGVLIDKAPSATYPVAAMNDLYAWGKNHNIKEIFEGIKNIGGRHTTGADISFNGTMPNYSEILTDTQIWDLTKFIKETSHNTNDFYDLSTSGNYPTGTKTFSNIGKGGDATNGKIVYDANCKMCHGADGTNINIYCKGEYLGDMFRGDPHEIQHKAVWGMPDDRDHFAAGCSTAAMMPPQNITEQTKTLEI